MSTATEIHLSAFPTRLIVDNPRIASWTAKAIWLLIPLQYYVLTAIQLGFRGEAFTPTASVLLIAILAIFIVSYAVATLGFVKDTLSDKEAGRAARARVWSTALLMTWGASLALYAAALGFTWLLESASAGAIDLRERDFVNYLLRYPWLKFTTEPLFTTEKDPLGLLVVSLIYSAAAVAIVVLLFRALRRAKKLNPPQVAGEKDEPRHVPAPDPNIFVVALVNTVLMTLLFSYIGGVCASSWIRSVSCLFVCTSSICT